jgi:hypothetical protein
MNKREQEKIVKIMEQEGLLVNYGRSLEKRGMQKGIQKVLALLDEETRNRIIPAL